MIDRWSGVYLSINYSDRFGIFYNFDSEIKSKLNFKDHKYFNLITIR